MNNKNKILVGCLALLLALSVGYSLFSDTITINGTATAKGSFDITATCETGISSKLGTVESLGLAKEGGYENDTCSVIDDMVSVSTDFLYPWARRHFTVKMKNNGTIDAVFSNPERRESKEMCVADNMEGLNKECVTSTSLSSTTSFKGYTANMYYAPLAIEDPEGNLLSESEMAEFIDMSNGMDNAVLVLKPGYSFYE